MNTLALRADGSVWRWGWESAATPRQVPAPSGVSGFLSGIVAVARGDGHSLALASDRTVWAWGDGFHGQLGDGTKNDRARPVHVKGPAGSGFLTDVVAIAAGWQHSLALRADGSVWAWGENGSHQLGTGGTTDSTVPVRVKGPGGVGFLSGMVAITAGSDHGLAVRSDGTVWSWGYNADGQLGDGTINDRSTPVQVKDSTGGGFLTRVIAVASGSVQGSSHSLALTSDGSVLAWGDNTYGQLGDGTTTQRNIPVQVRGPNGSGFLADIVALAASDGHSLAIKTDGTLWGWGQNGHGEAGDGLGQQDRKHPIQVVGTGGVGFLMGISGASGGRYFSVVHDCLATSESRWELSTTLRG